jgi:hypothetical protein
MRETCGGAPGTRGLRNCQISRPILIAKLSRAPGFSHAAIQAIPHRERQRAWPMLRVRNGHSVVRANLRKTRTLLFLRPLQPGRAAAVSPAHAGLSVSCACRAHLVVGTGAALSGVEIRPSSSIRHTQSRPRADGHKLDPLLTTSGRESAESVSRVVDQLVMIRTSIASIRSIAPSRANNARDAESNQNVMLRRRAKAFRFIWRSRRGAELIGLGQCYLPSGFVR